MTSQALALTICLSVALVSNAALVGHYTFDDAGSLFADTSGLANNADARC